MRNFEYKQEKMLVVPKDFFHVLNQADWTLVIRLHSDFIIAANLSKI